jgi:hypothetical protein
MFNFNLPSKESVKSTAIKAVKIAGYTTAAIAASYGAFRLVKHYAPGVTEAVADVASNTVDTAFETPVVGG